jgi:hypothetical protein
MVSHTNWLLGPLFHMPKVQRCQIAKLYSVARGCMVNTPHWKGTVFPPTLHFWTSPLSMECFMVTLVTCEGLLAGGLI